MQLKLCLSVVIISDTLLGPQMAQLSTRLYLDFRILYFQSILQSSKFFEQFLLSTVLECSLK